jgi:hypothetical protein
MPPPVRDRIQGHEHTVSQRGGPRVPTPPLLFAALLLLAPCDGRKKLKLSGGETKAQVTQLPGVGTVLPPVLLPIPTLPGVPGLVPRIPPARNSDP